MPSKKQKFDDINTFENCFQYTCFNAQNSFALKGKWKQNYFKNNNPIVIELGCGQGEYTIGLAQQYKNINYIGVDMKGNRLWTGANQAIQRNLTNVAFIRTTIDCITHCFDENEVSEIWITFPDPNVEKPRTRKRLTNPIFLNKYQCILIPNGLIHLKTDNLSFYNYTLEVLKELECKIHSNTNDLYQHNPTNKEELTSIKTYYETLFFKQGFTIKYVCFELNKNKKQQLNC